MTYYVGADIGTSSVKLLLINDQGAACAKCEESYSLSSPRPGWMEIEPNTWFSAAMRGLQRLLRGIDRGAVGGIGFTGQMHTAVFLDGEGESIRPAISWNDTRTAGLVTELKKEIAGHKELSSIGGILSTGSPAVNLLWLKREEPGNFAKLRTVLIGPDYMTYRFSGAYGTDYCEASTSSLFDSHSRKWSAGMCRIIGLPESVLPPIRGAGQIVGGLLPAVAEALGLPQSVRVITGTGDNPAAYLSSGQLTSGEPMISLGTSGVLMFSREKGDGRAKGKPILFSLGDRHFRTIVQGAVQSTGSSFRWWAKDILRGESFDDISGQVDCSGDVNQRLLFYPHLAGDKTIYADPYLRGAFIGLGSDTSREEATRAVLEGIGFAFRQLMEKMHAGRELHSIKVTGGMTRMHGFMQILADILNVCLEVSENISAAEGIAQLAAHSCGVGKAFELQENQSGEHRIFRPRTAFVERYDEKYCLYAKIYHALRQVYADT